MVTGRPTSAFSAGLIDALILGDAALAFELEIDVKPVVLADAGEGCFKFLAAETPVLGKRQVGFDTE
jgi:hypothetical protein